MSFLASLIVGNLVGAAFGLVFAIVAEEKIKKNFIFAGIFSSYLGWFAGILLPVHEDKALGTMGFSIISAFYGAFIYWSSKAGPHGKPLH